MAFHGAWSTECYMDSGVQHKARRALGRMEHIALIWEAYVMLLELCSSSLESVIRSRRDQPEAQKKTAHDR